MKKLALIFSLLIVSAMSFSQHSIRSKNQQYTTHNVYITLERSAHIAGIILFITFPAVQVEIVSASVVGSDVAPVTYQDGNEYRIAWVDMNGVFISDNYPLIHLHVKVYNQNGPFRFFKISNIELANINGDVIINDNLSIKSII